MGCFYSPFSLFDVGMIRDNQAFVVELVGDIETGGIAS